MGKQLDQKASYLLIIYSLIVLGYIYNLGFYSITSLVILTFSAFLSLFFWRLNFSKNIFNMDFGGIAKLVLVCFVVLSNYLYGGLFQTSHPSLATASKFLLALCVPFSFTYFLKFNKTMDMLVRFRFWVFILIVIALKIFMVWSSPAPLIDVYGIQKLAPKSILDGHSPYSVEYHFSWEKVPLSAYTYGPFNIYLNFASFLLAADPRYVQMIAEIGVGLLIYLILGKNKWTDHRSVIAEILSLIFLFSPRALFILEQSWIDPTVVFLLTLFTYLLFVWRKQTLGYAVLGLAIATKQYTILVIPFLYFSGLLKLRNLLTIFIVVLLVSLPFIVWSLKDFVSDVVLFSIFIYPSRYDSLSWNSFVHNFTGYDIPKVLIIFMEIVLFWFLVKKQNKFVGSQVILNTGILLLFTFLVYRIAFINYYYLAASIVFISLVMTLYENDLPRKHLSKK